MHFASDVEEVAVAVAEAQTPHFLEVKPINSGESDSWREMCAAVLLFPKILHVFCCTSPNLINAHLFAEGECKALRSARKDCQGLSMLKKSQPFCIIH
jgi:hypothetical protein